MFSALLAADKEGGICQDMLEAAPLLIAHLSGGMGTATAEQCAWILGENCVRKDKQLPASLPSQSSSCIFLPHVAGLSRVKEEWRSTQGWLWCTRLSG